MLMMCKAIIEEHSLDEGWRMKDNSIFKIKEDLYVQNWWGWLKLLVRQIFTKVSLGAQAIQCDERDAPQCFLCQPTSRNNSAREGSTAGALASKLNLRNISLAALKECTHNPSFSGGDGFMMKQDDEWLLQSWDFYHSIKRLQKTTTPTPCSQNNRTRLRIWACRNA